MGKFGISRSMAAVAAALFMIMLISCGESREPAAAESGSEPAVQQFEESREQIEEQMAGQLRHEVLSDHIAELREDMDITIYKDALDSDDEFAVIARVNSSEVHQWELNYLVDEQIRLMNLAGEDPQSDAGQKLIREIQPRLIDRIISSAVLEQRALEIGLTATEEQITQQFQMLAEVFGGKAELEAELARSDLTTEELKQDIARQLPAQMYAEHYVETAIDPRDLEFSDAQLREFYEQRIKP